MHRRRSRTSPRRALAFLATLLLAAGLTALISPRAQADVTTAFAKRFGVNTNGGIVLRGNSNLTCRTADAGCAAAQAGTGSSLNNDGFEMRYVNVDPAGGANFNSSSSTLTLGAGSTVLFAGLYWSGDTESATNTGNGDAPIASPSVADKNKVRFRAPGGAYQTVTASRVDSVTAIAGRDFYQGFADVTNTVAAAGNGSYTVANVQATQNDSRYAGWALIVVYRNPADPVRNLTVFDGFGYINSAGTPSVDIAVSGFETPPTGAVHSKIGTVVYEGDLGITGDALKLSGTTLSDVSNPATNYFNSTVSDSGTLDTARNPSYQNLMSVDIDQFSTTALANGASSATLNLSTSQDTFYPGAVTMATDLYAPDIKADLTASDTNGGLLKPGDEIEYTVTVRNQGNDGATDLVITDAIPSGTNYVPGSLRVDGATRTDAAGDDPAELQAGTARFRLGSGATGASGGTLAIGGSTVVTFRVVVDPDTPGGTTITDVANISVKGQNSNPPLELTGASNVSALTVTAAAVDLVVTGTVSPGTVQKDGVDDPLTYTVNVVNNGPDAQPATVLAVTLPSHVTPSAGSWPSGSCSVAGQVVTCPLGRVAAGATVSTTVTAVADGSAADPATATATVTGKYADSAVANNTTAIDLAVNRAPVAGNDTASTPHQTAVTRTVLSNDSDPDGDALHVASADPPAHGGAVVNGNNTITYTPAAGFKGAEVVTYHVADTRGGSTTGTFTVTVANAAPVANPDTTGTAARTPVTVDVLGNDTDVNTGETLTVTGSPTVTGGTATGTAVNNGDGTLTFTPGNAFGGVATITYTLSDGTATATGTLSVTVANQQPVAADDLGTTAYNTDRTIAVTGNDTDPNGDTLTVTAVTQPADGSVSSTGGTVTWHAVSGFSGLVTFTYTISDGHGGSAVATVRLTVDNAAPTPAGDSGTTAHHQAIDLDVLDNDTDPNGETLTISSAGPAAHGQVTVVGGQLRYLPDAGFSGQDTFTYTAYDGHDGTAATVTVTVLNAPPTATADARTIEADTSVTVPVLLNDIDPNTADTLSVDSFDAVTVQGGAVIRVGGSLRYTPPAGYLGTDSFTYTVTDGTAYDTTTVTIMVRNGPPDAAPDAATTPTGATVVVPVLSNDTDPGDDTLTITAITAPASGSITVAGTTISYTPNPTFHGLDTFTYTVGDGRGGTDTTTVTITVLNAPPVATADAHRVEPGRPTVIRVLANDTDANAHSLAVSAAGNGTHGTVTVATDGSAVTYTPNANAPHTTDTFSYTVSDGNGGTDTATVTVTINAAPVASSDGPVPTGTGTPVTVPVRGNDSDVENDALTVTAGPAMPAHGQITVDGNGAVVYTPAPGYAGTDTFEYTVTDPAGGSDTATVTVHVANAVPVATADTTATAPGTTATVHVLANDTDANVVPGGQTLAVDAVTQPVHGTVVNHGTHVTYAPGAYKGTDTFTYTVTDGHGGTATTTVTVIVTNAAPAAAPDAADTDESTAVTLDVVANDSDPNGDADTLRVTAVTAPRDAGGVDRGTVQAGDRTVTYTPPAGFRGPVTFLYTVEDGDGLPASALVTITVANVAPTAAGDTAQTPYRQPVIVVVTGNDTDANGDDLTVTSASTPRSGAGAPAGTATITADGKAVTYQPRAGFSGTAGFGYTIADGHGGTATAAVTVVVALPPAVPDKVVKAGPGAPVQVPVPATDEHGRRVTLVSTGAARHGTVRVNPDGTISYTPRKGYTGTDSFSYTVQDGDGNRASGVISVQVTAAPTAPDEAVRTGKGKPTTVDVLEGAKDRDGDRLTLVDVGTPAHGTVKINADGTVTYTPDPGYSGADAFSYTVTDPDGNTSTGLYTVSVGTRGEALPRTGADVMSTATFGTAVLLLGAGLLWYGRRRPAVARGRHRR